MTIPLPVLPGVFRCSLKWGGTAGLPTVPVNVIHLLASGTGPTAAGAYNALNSCVTAGMWGAIANTAIVNEVDVIPLDGTSPTTSFTTGNPSKWSGQDTGQGIPQVAALCKLTTALRGRKHRGRIYLPYISEAQANLGTLNPPTQATMQTAWTAFIAALNSLTPAWTLQVTSYDRHGLPTPSPSTSDVLTVTVESYLATQRRRQPGRHISRH